MFHWKKPRQHWLWCLWHTLHRGALCQFPFRWVYYYGSNKSTGKETVKTHLCAVYFFLFTLYILHTSIVSWVMEFPTWEYKIRYILTLKWLSRKERFVFCHLTCLAPLLKIVKIKKDALGTFPIMLTLLDLTPEQLVQGSIEWISLSKMQLYSKSLFFELDTWNFG